MSGYLYRLCWEVWMGLGMYKLTKYINLCVWEVVGCVCVSGTCVTYGAPDEERISGACHAGTHA